MVYMIGPMKDIQFTLIYVSNPYNLKSDVEVVLELQNDSDRDVSVNRDALMLDGFRSDKFRIHNPEQTKQLPYMGKNVKYYPGRITIKAHEKIESKLNLADAYDFSNTSYNEAFIIDYEAHARICYEDEGKCSGEILHDEIAIDLR